TRLLTQCRRPFPREPRSRCPWLFPHDLGQERVHRSPHRPPSPLSFRPPATASLRFPFVLAIPLRELHRYPASLRPLLLLCGCLPLTSRSLSCLHGASGSLRAWTV